MLLSGLMLLQIIKNNNNKIKNKKNKKGKMVILTNILKVIINKPS